MSICMQGCPYYCWLTVTVSQTSKTWKNMSKMKQQEFEETWALSVCAFPTAWQQGTTFNPAICKILWRILVYYYSFLHFVYFFNLAFMSTCLGQMPIYNNGLQWTSEAQIQHLLFKIDFWTIQDRFLDWIEKKKDQYSKFTKAAKHQSLWLLQTACKTKEKCLKKNAGPAGSGSSLSDQLYAVSMICL